MNTLVKKASVMWADEDTKTALNAWELLLAQRFVIYAQFSCFGMTSRFCSVDRPRSLRALADQAGNSMPVQLIMLAFLWAIVAVETQPEIQVSEHMSLLVHLARKRRRT